MGFAFLISVPLFLLLFFIVGRAIHIWYSSKGVPLPEAAKPLSNTARRTEALVLVLVGGGFLVFLGFQGECGRLGNLFLTYTPSSWTPALAWTQIALLTVAILLISLGAFLAWRGHTKQGMIATAAVIGVYALVTILFRDQIQAFANSSKPPESPVLTFKTMGPDVTGADLWVNDVYLGKIPVEIPLDDLVAKVPPWPKKERAAMGSTLYWTALNSQEYGCRWEEINLDRFREAGHSIPDGYFCARVEYQGKPGAISGGGGTTLRLGFPQRQRDLKCLLNQARLSDYKVGAAWLEALEAFGDDGWMTLLKAGEKEPEFLAILDAWATSRYALDEVTDADSAWGAFGRVLDDVEARGSYATAGLEGRAITLLVPRLDHEQVAARAEKSIGPVAASAYPTWHPELWGPVGLISKGTGQYWNPGANGFAMSGSAESSPLGFAISHALWLLHERLAESGGSGPDIVQQRIGPALIRQAYSRSHYYIKDGRHLAAARLGGPAVAQFFLRKPWKERVDFPHQNAMRPGSGHVNGWLYLASHLSGPEGTRFRMGNANRCLDLADAVWSSSWGWDPELDFLFMDLHEREKSLAWKYWPRFYVKTSDLDMKEEILRTRWEYLMRLEPLSTVEMYVKCFREQEGRPWSDWAAWSVLSALPDVRRREVVHALMDFELERRDLKISAAEAAKEYWFFGIMIAKGSLEESAELTIDELKSDSAVVRAADIADWLEHGAPDHPLVAMLARESDPALRLLVMGALREHPSPENRAVLESLLADPDETVRAAAREVKQALQELADTPPKDFAWGTTSGADEGTI